MPIRDFYAELIADEIKRLTPVLGKETAERLEKAYLLGEEETRKRIIEMVDTLKAAVYSDKDLKDSVLIEPPSRDVAGKGEIEIGTVLYGRKQLYPLRISKNSLLTHLAIFGSSGYGKTNISYMLAEKLSDDGVPVIIFDFSKRNYKDLLSTRLRDRIEIYTVGRDPAVFRFNPLKPPEGIQLSQWIKEFAAVFDHAYWLLGGGRHIIMKVLSDVYEKRLAQGQQPRMNDLKVWLDKYSKSEMGGRERNWLATAERPLESLCFKEIGDVFDCDTGITPDRFFEKLGDRGKITILELDSLSTNDKTFFIEIVLQWIRDWLLIQGDREQLRGAVILEEAHHVLNREKSSKMGSETVIELIFREVRELGLGVVYLDQHPSLISYPALGNTSMHIYMNLGLDTKHASDIQDASNMLGLNYDKDGVYLRQLRVGHGFVLCRMSEFPHPFLVEFPLFNIEKGKINDDDIRAFMRQKVEQWYAEESAQKEVHESAMKEPVKDYEFLKKTRHLQPEAAKASSAATANVLSIAKPRIDINKIDETGWKIVHTIGIGDGSSTSQIYKALRMSGSVFNENAKKLKDMGVISSAEAKIGRQRALFYCLTEAGKAVFENRFSGSNKQEPVSTDNVERMLQLSGWVVKHAGDRLACEKPGMADNGKKLIIQVVSLIDMEKIANAMRECTHFLCSSERTKNAVLQQAAHASKTVCIATTREFEEKGRFGKVEF